MFAKKALAAAKIADAGGSAPDFSWSTSVTNSSMTLTNDNRTATNSGSGYQTALVGLPTTSGKWYWEVTETISNNFGNTGLGTSTSNNQFYQDTSGNYFIQRSSESSFTNQGSWTSNGTTSTIYSSASVRFGYAYDTATNKVWIRVNNGSWIGGGDPAAGTTPTVTISGTVYLVGSTYDTNTQSFTITSRTSQTDTPPSGFTAIGGPGTGGGGSSLQYKYGSCPGGTSMSGISYSSLANGPFNLTVGNTESFTGTTGDRCVVIDLGNTYNNSNTTATQTASNYFSVWTSDNGTTWTERVAYSSVGTSYSYTYSLSGTSHRYIAYTSGEGGAYFNSIKVNSYS